MKTEEAYQLLDKLLAQPLSMTKPDHEFMASMREVRNNDKGLTIKMMENIYRIHKAYM